MSLSQLSDSFFNGKKMCGKIWIQIVCIPFLATHLFAADQDLFESKIRPILVEHCYECHSEGKKQKGNLLLDTKEATLKGGDTGPTFVAGDPEKSLLIKAVKWLSDDLQMPPKKKLSDEQLADLEAWVKMGAPDPRTGARTLTKIEQHLENSKKHWSFQPIVDPKPASLDALISTKSSPPAGKRILIRRAYLDLIGLPPTYAEVNAFLADNSAQAFEQLIDRLLANPRYGERWGRHWLDVVRYADNMGSIYNGDDSYPNAFTYRDYVIKSFNADKPYDQFIIEQIAADHIKAAPEDLAAMGFLGLGRRKDRRLDDDTLDDTLDVIGRGLLGLSIGCARCHDHKLEPITTKDYYGLYAVLKSSKEPEVAPALPQQDTPQTKEFVEKNRQARTDYSIASLKAASAVSGEARTRVGDYLLAAYESDWKTIYEHKTIKDVLLKRKLHGDLHNATTRSLKPWIEALPAVFGPWQDAAAKKPIAIEKLHPLVAKALAGKTGATLEELAKIYNDLFASIDSEWRKLAAVEYDKTITLTSVELDIPLPKMQSQAIARLDQIESRVKLPETDRESLRQILFVKDSPMKIAPERYGPAKLFTEEQKATMTKLERVAADLAKHPGAPARAMVFFDEAKPHEGKVFVRGNPKTLGPDAPRQFLTALKHISPEPFPKDRSGRLELAKAIANKDNPLTARVIVNRVWAWHFGDSIVGTPSDFGFRGDKPSNQALLDHLAAQFMKNDWSFKKLHKYVMLTSAYQRADFPMRPLDLEPFRDSLLAVTGRLQSDYLGKAEKVSETTRRTVYAFVDRKTLPSLYRSFDFPDPNFSAPKRSRTALTPRALILMNSPLLTDSAKALAGALTKDLPDETSRVEELYRRVMQRQPTDREMQRAHDYLAAYPQNDLVHPESNDWQYGYGELDAAAKQVKAFSALKAFDGKSFKGTLKTTDGKASEVKLDAMGGDPGLTPAMSSIRRWVAPLDGDINITAELTHTDAKTEGVVARIISSRNGPLGEWKAKSQSLCTELTKVPVKKGDTLDFIVSSQTDKDAGPYQWSPSIIVPGSTMPGMPGMAQRWDARVDFADPSKPAKPLTAWEELCQALLLSPEFAVME